MMNRRSLIKSLFTIAVAPKMIAEMEFNPPMVSPIVPTAGLFRDLQVLTPEWMAAMIAKYGQDDFVTHVAKIEIRTTTILSG